MLSKQRVFNVMEYFGPNILFFFYLFSFDFIFLFLFLFLFRLGR